MKMTGNRLSIMVIKPVKLETNGVTIVNTAYLLTRRGHLSGLMSTS